MERWVAYGPEIVALAVVSALLVGQLGWSSAGPLAAWVGAAVTAAAVWVALTANRKALATSSRAVNVAESSLEEARQRSERDQVIALNRHSAEAVADLWAAILAIRRPFDGFAAEARKSGAFGINGPRASVERLADELQEKLASAEAALFYARAVLPAGTVLHQTEEVDTRFAELRDLFEAGSDADQSVFDWLGTLTEKLEEVLTFKDLTLKLVRFHFPMNWAEIERVRIDEERRGEQLGFDTYIRAKAWHYRIPYRFAPRKSWREMGREPSQHLDGENLMTPDR